MVDGDPDMLRLLRLLFRDEGYAVTATNFAPDTLDQIAAFRPGALLVDVAWGQRAGWDLLAQLHRDARTRGLPVVAMSTTLADLAAIVTDPGRYGVDATLAKPFGIDDILDTVRSLTSPA